MKQNQKICSSNFWWCSFFAEAQEVECAGIVEVLLYRLTQAVSTEDVDRQGPERLAFNPENKSDYQENIFSGEHLNRSVGFFFDSAGILLGSPPQVLIKGGLKTRPWQFVANAGQTSKPCKIL